MKHYTKTDKKNGIAHWTRMITWAKTRNQYLEKPSITKMKRVMGETYGPDDCVLCKKFLDHPKCLLCPFNNTKNDCRKEGSLQDQMQKALVWPQWIKAAEKMLKVLSDLPTK